MNCNTTIRLPRASHLRTRLRPAQLIPALLVPALLCTGSLTGLSRAQVGQSDPTGSSARRSLADPEPVRSTIHIASDSTAVSVEPIARAVDRTLTAVIRMTARYFGVPEDSLSAQTDLQADLHADPLDAWELVAMVCQQHRRPLPEQQVLTRIGDIADYIAKVPRSGAQAQGHGEPDEHPIHTQTVFYATTRAVNDPGDPRDFYGTERAPRARGLQYGYCEVTIPVSAHEAGKLESPNFFKLEFKPDPRKHIVLQKVEILDRDSFLSSLHGKLAAASDADDWSADAMVFIHGYNMSFAKATRRTAQIAYDFGFPGAPVLFSWPSDGSLLGYVSDREDAEWSVPYLRDMLTELRDKAGARRLHLVAHSMGNQVLIRALRELAWQRDGGEPLFANVILAAPDFDARVFTEQIAPQVIGLAQRWTVYASDKDVALDASRILSARRLGTPLSLIEGIDSIDATGVDVAPWSVPELHAYYASKLRVVQDLVGVIKGLDPQQRGLTPRVRTGIRYWALESR